MEASSRVRELSFWSHYIGYVLGDQDRIDSAPVQLIYERQRCHPAICRMDACITNDGFSTILQNTT